MYGLAKIALDYKPFNKEIHRAKPLTVRQLQKSVKKLPNKYEDMGEEIAHREKRVDNATHRTEQLRKAWIDHSRDHIQMAGKSKARALHSPEVQNDHMRLLNAFRRSENMQRIQEGKLKVLNGEHPLTLY